MWWILVTRLYAQKAQYYKCDCDLRGRRTKTFNLRKNRTASWTFQICVSVYRVLIVYSQLLCKNHKQICITRVAEQICLNSAGRRCAEIKEKIMGIQQHARYCPFSKAQLMMWTSDDAASSTTAAVLLQETLHREWSGISRALCSTERWICMRIHILITIAPSTPKCVYLCKNRRVYEEPQGAKENIYDCMHIRLG